MNNLKKSITNQFWDRVDDQVDESGYGSGCESDL